MQSLYQLILVHRGFQIETAPDGRSGLEILESRDFDLLLVDDMMPVMDGVEMTRRVRANPRWDRLPIVMCGARGDTGYLAAAWEAGIDARIAKPSDLNDLCRKLQELIESGRPDPSARPA